MSRLHTARRLSLVDRPDRPSWSRWLQLFGGIVLFGMAAALMIQSELGLGPWDALHVGLHRMTGMSVGVATIVVGIVIVAGTLLIKVRPGPGTIANMVLIGVFTDVFMLLVPVADGWLLSFLMFMSGVLLCAFATGMYIAAGLGIGPRDGLMIGVSRMTGRRVGRVRTAIEVVVLAVGWLMGGTIGIGTILFALTIGPATQWGLQLFGMSSTGASRTEASADAPPQVALNRAA